MSRAEIRQATSVEDYAAGKALIEEYAEALGVDLSFQNFSAEIADLPKMYGAGRGCLLLARIDREWVGCVAIRSQSADICEMKRLYVKPQYRRSGIGKRLAETAIRSAQKLDYSRIVLDTLASMTEAQSIYESLGFREITGYCSTPLEAIRYFARDLAGGLEDTA